jgi:uncharacterized membrane protein YecN with MAPEG domain
MSSNINGNTQIPEMIVVAVPNTNRRRDLTPTHTLLDGEGNEKAPFAASGDGDKFLQFFREELFPAVESSYRTIPHRTIVGNSLGGLLALHARVQSPDLFQGYIANDPSLWWDDQYVLRQAKEAIAPDRKSIQSVFISSAANLNDRISEMAQQIFSIALLPLTFQAGLKRLETKIFFGDGGNLALAQRRTAQSNFLDHVPLFMVSLILCELLGAHSWLVIGAGSVMLLGRIIHAYCMLFTSGVGNSRAAGMLLTFAAHLATSGFLAASSLGLTA